MSTTKRIVSLDQFRGYTILAMLVVNFVGRFDTTHWLLKHHNVFCSFPDTIMPQFLFAVGFAYRLTFLRRVEADGAAAAYARMVRRLLGLVVVSLIVYTTAAPAGSWAELSEFGFWQAIRRPLKGDWFQTLMHIAVTSLWVLPVVRAGVGVRVAYLLGSAGLHVWLSHLFYFHWVNNGDPNGIDGGPLGFLTWTVPLIVGTLAYDAVAEQRDGRRLRPMLTWAAVLMAAGYAMSCGTRLYDVPEASQPAATKLAEHPVIPTAEQLDRAREKLAGGNVRGLLAEPPFVPPPHPGDDIGQGYRVRPWNYWMMSQRSGTLSYLTFAAGFSLAVYALFSLACDRLGWRLPLLATFGSNALAAYVLHMLVANAAYAFMPRDSPAWYVWSGFAVYLGLTYLVVRGLERQNVHLRL